MNALRLSVVIPTYNRRELLAKTLDSLARVRVAPGEMEVIVVDDGSQDGTAEALARRKDPFPLRVLRHESSQGPAAARNRGAAAARGEILGFLDSDVTVDPGWWQAAKPHFTDPGVGALEGATLLPPGAGRPTPFSHFVHNQRGRSFQTCNFFFRRAVFLAAGGFDERFCWQDRRGRLWHVREDTDLAFTLLDQGQRIEFEPAAQAFHPLFPAPRNIYWTKTYYGAREVLLRRKHPGQYRRYLSWIDGRAFPVFYWGVFIGLPLAIAAAARGWTLPLLAGSTAFLLGWAGSVYAVCRKRQVRWPDLAILIPQFLLIPWARLYWVVLGEIKYRDVKPVSVTSTGEGNTDGC